MKKNYILTLTLTLITAISFGQVLVVEDFSYSDGSLVGNSEWENVSGTAGDFLVSSGQAVVTHGDPSEDVKIPFTAGDGSIYVGFDFSVDDLGAPYGTGTDFEYFAHIGFKARIDIVSGSNGGDYSIGISSGGSTAESTWATDLTFAQSYRLIAKYDQTTGVAELWINPTASTDTSISGSESIGDVASFDLRQSDSSENETVRVDNLMIGKTFGDVLTFSATASLKNNSIEGFATYPNPVTNNVFTIKSNSSDTKEISIFNVLGKQVLFTSLSGVQSDVDVSSISAGLYILKVTEGTKIATTKLVIK
jgi:hypothetical protein